MTTFEFELRKVLDKNRVFEETTFVGRACFGKVNEDVRARIEFHAPRVADHYSALKVTLINAKEGPIDTMLLRFQDLIGEKSLPNDACSRSATYLWDCNGEVEWYSYKPTLQDYRKITDAINSYVDMFRGPVLHQHRSPEPEFEQQMG